MLYIDPVAFWRIVSISTTCKWRLFPLSDNVENPNLILQWVLGISQYGPLGPGVSPMRQIKVKKLARHLRCWTQGTRPPRRKARCLASGRPRPAQWLYFALVDSKCVTFACCCKPLKNHWTDFMLLLGDSWVCIIYTHIYLHAIHIRQLCFIYFNLTYVWIKLNKYNYIQTHMIYCDSSWYIHIRMVIAYPSSPSSGR